MAISPGLAQRYSSTDERLKMSQLEQEVSEAADLPVSERLTFAGRQAAIMAVALLILSSVTEASRPSEAADRDLVTSPFLWSIVLWMALLLFNALAFERSQMRELEGVPSLVSLALGVAFFAVGAAVFDAGSTADRMRYLALNSIGVVLFWWALIGLGYLMWRRVTADDQDSTTETHSTEATTPKSTSPGRAATGFPDAS